MYQNRVHLLDLRAPKRRISRMKDLKSPDGGGDYPQGRAPLRHPHGSDHGLRVRKRGVGEKVKLLKSHLKVVTADSARLDKSKQKKGAEVETVIANRRRICASQNESSSFKADSRLNQDLRT